MPITTKAKGATTIGVVAVTPIESGRTAEVPWEPEFRSRIAQSEAEVISYDESNEDFLVKRRKAETKCKTLYDSYRRLLRDKRRRWKSDKKVWMEKSLDELLKEVQSKRVKYTYAEISIDPLYRSIPISIDWYDKWGTPIQRDIGYRVCNRPDLFQKLFCCSRYKLNANFRSAVRASGQTIAGAQGMKDIPKDGAGRKPVWSDRVPDDATGKIWMLPANKEYDIRFDGWYAPAGYPLGWYRLYTRIRKLTAKEASKMARDFAKRRKRLGRYSTVLLTMWERDYILQHPFPDVTTDEEVRDIWSRLQSAQRELRACIEFHRVHHQVASGALGERTCENTFTQPTIASKDALTQFELACGVEARFGHMGHIPVVVNQTSAGTLLRESQVVMHPEAGTLTPTIKTWADVLQPLDGLPLIELDLSQGNTTSWESPINFDAFEDPADPLVKYDPDVGDIRAQAARAVLKLEGLGIDEHSLDRLSRSVAECKDLPATGTQAASFLAFMANPAGEGKYIEVPKQALSSVALRQQWEKKYAPRLVVGKTGARYFVSTPALRRFPFRTAAKLWLWWKMGVEPIAHDVNALCSGTGNYLSSFRRGLVAMYTGLGNCVNYDATFRKRPYHKPDLHPRSPVGDEKVRRIRLLFPMLPCMYDADYGYSTRTLTAFSPEEDRGTVRLSESLRIDGQLFDRWPNGNALISGESGVAGSYSAYHLLGEILVKLIRPRCIGIEHRIQDVAVFTRFAASEIQRALDVDSSMLTRLFDEARAITVSWELIPFSFILDWFQRVRAVTETLDFQAFLKAEGLELKSLFGPWVGLRWKHWETYSGFACTATRAVVGSYESLRDAGWTEGYPADWASQQVFMNTWYCYTHKNDVAAALAKGWNPAWVRNPYTFRNIENTWSYYDAEAQWKTVSTEWLMVPLDVQYLGLEFEIRPNKPRILTSATEYYRGPMGSTSSAYVPTVHPNLSLAKFVSLAALFVQYFRFKAR